MTVEELAAEVRELLDRAAIGDVVSEYCAALDAMDLDRLVALFTEDCVVDYGPGHGMCSDGRCALRRDLERLWRWARTSHHSSSLQIAFTGPDRAHATSYVLAWHEAPDGTTATMMGRYRDEFVRERSGWRIARRRQELTGNDEGFTVAINPFVRRPRPSAGA